MINIKDLKESDVGRWVEYIGHQCGKCDRPPEKKRGRITSWNETFIFAVYSCEENWEAYQAYTAMGALPADLKFIEELPDEWKKEKCECGHQFESMDDYIMVGEVKICWGCAENNQ